MSAGQYIRGRYQASYGGGTSIHPIRYQPETQAAVINSVTNNPPDGDINNPISAQVSRGGRARGLRPRSITIQFPNTGQPTGYAPGGTTIIPALTQEFFDAATPGADITYLGVLCTVVGRTAESAD